MNLIIALVHYFVFKNIYFTLILFAYFTNFIRIFMRIFEPIYSHKSLDSTHESCFEKLVGAN